MKKLLTSCITVIMLLCSTSSFADNCTSKWGANTLVVDAASSCVLPTDTEVTVFGTQYIGIPTTIICTFSNSDKAETLISIQPLYGVDTISLKISKDKENINQHVLTRPLGDRLQRALLKASYSQGTVSVLCNRWL